MVPGTLSPPRRIALEEGLRVWAEIDLDRIAANVRGLRERAATARLLAVVKANAYGHGAVPVAHAAIEAGAWGLGVIGVEEGEELRLGRIEAPIVVLGAISPAMAARAVANDLRTTVAAHEVVQALAGAAQQQGRRAYVHVKVETGLNRYGLRLDEAVALAETARGLAGVEVEGLTTHLASVDEGDKTFTFEQFKAFCQAAERLPWIPIHHLASTGAVLDLPELDLAMIRTGIGLYGYYPSEAVSRSVALAPALSLRSRVGRVATVEAGESVGYARDWVAERRSRVATVMAGYGDGVSRALTNRGVVLTRGRRLPIVGRVAMDMLMVDVTALPEAAVEDEVTLIGEQAGETLGADEVGRLGGTISYEVLAGITARVPRLFVREDRVVARQDLGGYREAPPA